MAPELNCPLQHLQRGTNLSELAKSLQKYPESQLLIVGHTDNVGDTSYNQRLSERPLFGGHVSCDAGCGENTPRGDGQGRVRADCDQRDRCRAKAESPCQSSDLCERSVLSAPSQEKHRRLNRFRWLIDGCPAWPNRRAGQSVIPTASCPRTSAHRQPRSRRHRK